MNIFYSTSACCKIASQRVGLVCWGRVPLWHISSSSCGASLQAGLPWTLWSSSSGTESLSICDLPGILSSVCLLSTQAHADLQQIPGKKTQEWQKWSSNHSVLLFIWATASKASDRDWHQTREAGKFRHPQTHLQGGPRPLPPHPSPSLSRLLHTCNPMHWFLLRFFLPALGTQYSLLFL